MGTAAYIQVVNKSSSEVGVSLSDVQCMYDGEYNSSLEPFYDNVVPAGDSLPPSPQYILTDAGLGCVVHPSQFTLSFQGIGEVTVQCVHDVYSSTGNDSPQIDADISPGSDGYSITIYLLPSGSA